MTDKKDIPDIEAGIVVLPTPASAPSAASDASTLPEALKASFKGVVLLCVDCEARSSGPKKLRVKEVRKTMKNAVRPARGHLRVAITGCLGPCPKKAMTVAVLAGGVVSLRALRRTGDVEAVGAEAVGLLARG